MPHPPRSLIAMWIGVGLLVLSWLFPPFVNITKERYKNEVRTYHFGVSVFTSTNYYWHPDFGRLLLIDSAIAAVTVAVMVSLRNTKP